MLGAALGFGAQQVVRDLIAGTFIVLERQYGYGDVVHISAVGFTEGATGTIEEVALRTTRLRTLNGEVVIVPNGQFVQVTNLPLPRLGPRRRGRAATGRGGRDARQRAAPQGRRGGVLLAVACAASASAS